MSSSSVFNVNERVMGSFYVEDVLSGLRYSSALPPFNVTWHCRIPKHYRWSRAGLCLLTQAVLPFYKDFLCLNQTWGLRDNSERWIGLYSQKQGLEQRVKETANLLCHAHSPFPLNSGSHTGGRSGQQSDAEASAPRRNTTLGDPTPQYTLRAVLHFITIFKTLEGLDDTI